MTATLGTSFTQIRRAAGSARAFVKDTGGSTAIEYSLIVGLIFLAIVGAVRSFTDSTSDMYEEITTTLEGAPN